ncbi:MAG: hypothetical protein JWN76_3787 [Chitinophagaceae bacterium]|nr:hypothetical protein [Chitinophagaceae bacterium]
MRIRAIFLLVIVSGAFLFGCSSNRMITTTSGTANYPGNSPILNDNSVNGPSGTTGTRFDRDILFYINQYRASLGKQPLQWNDAVYVQAEKHSANMAARRTAFGHTGFPERITAISRQLGFIGASAENVAYGQQSAQEVVNGWINSSGHRKNIQGDYNLTAVGTATARDGSIYFTQIFVRK